MGKPLINRERGWTRPPPLAVGCSREERIKENLLDKPFLVEKIIQDGNVDFGVENVSLK